MTTQKSYLPYIIIGVFVLFITFILQFVFRSMQNDVQLVSKNYYQQEIEYQTHIDKVERSTSIQENSTIIINNEQLIVNIAPEITQAKGIIHIYNGSDATLDIEIPFEFNKNSSLIFPTKNLQQGVWTIKVDFESEGKNFYIEEKIVK